ncbi:hypothetical protein C8F01DRAFT_325864 [Mycena amicta]|nr:hypothetical protein C8F01DRAFT_325864 [Mycena amicta]
MSSNSNDDYATVLNTIVQHAILHQMTLQPYIKFVLRWGKWTDIKPEFWQKHTTREAILKVGALGRTSIASYVSTILDTVGAAGVERAVLAQVLTAEGTLRQLLAAVYGSPQLILWATELGDSLTLVEQFDVYVGARVTELRGLVFFRPQFERMFVPLAKFGLEFMQPDVPAMISKKRKLAPALGDPASKRVSAATLSNVTNISTSAGAATTLSTPSPDSHPFTPPTVAPRKLVKSRRTSENDNPSTATVPQPE